MKRTTTVRAAAWSALSLVLVGTVGCASVKLDASTPTPATLEKLRGSTMTPMQAGKFALAGGKPTEMDRTLPGLRGNSLTPAKGSFAQLLKDTLVVELTAAGLHDANSQAVIEGELTDSQIDAAIGTGTGRLAARFKVRRGGQQIFDKELAVQSSWESSFLGAVAVPAAMNQYHGLYKTLVAKLVDDAEFRKAVAR
jgi:hypothetical protein